MKPEHNSRHILNDRGDYVAFLVEYRNHPQGLRYLAFDDNLEICWVPEADDATHLARRSDAETLVKNSSDVFDLHIADHMWPGGVPRDGVVECVWRTPDVAAGLVWTKEPPKEPGWYWYRSPNRKAWAVEVIKTASGMQARFEWGWMTLESCHNRSEWAGPISTPAEPTEAQE